MRLDDVVAQIRGEKGTVVRLNVIPVDGADEASATVVSITRDTVKLEDQLSYFIVLQEPNSGGELVLYDLLYKDTPDHLIEDSAFFNIPDERDRALEAYDNMIIKPKAGDMIIFDGGRIWHKVSEIEGALDRITIGGFMAFSNNDKSIYYWS
ncbi:MAG: hypothetical protein COB85_04585 [Bacteroidetes bacterium]|nr:MAG: hypothetical protein COB85_04585 [Bacteroidota bacterium]